MTFVDMQVKWYMTLTDRLGPEILTVLEIKGQVLHPYDAAPILDLNEAGRA